jgi:hypothetical protein
MPLGEQKSGERLVGLAVRGVFSVLTSLVFDDIALEIDLLFGHVLGKRFEPVSYVVKFLVRHHVCFFLLAAVRLRDLDRDDVPFLVAREIVKAAEAEKKIVLKGAIFDGEYYDGDAGVKLLGSFPTREEAQAKVVTLVLSPARNIMGVVKTIQEKLEKGEAIAKA